MPQNQKQDEMIMKNRNLTTNQNIVLNLVASFITYIITFGISFFLSPYIVKTIGVEAYGFVSLANNFISYASLITIALDALAGRFITIKLRNKDYEGANRYFTSVFFGNAFMSVILFIVALFCWFFLEKIIQIPNDIFWDVKILFATLFLNCIVNTVTSVFSVATFAKNKLYLNSIRQIESSIFRAIILIVLFALCPAKVFYLGITTLVTGLYTIVYNIYYTYKLTPELKIKKMYFDKKTIIELVSSGVWNLINRLGQILTDGLDLLITNLFIDTTSMGVLSLAKTIPSVITGIVGNMVGSFSPNFTILYADGKIDELKKSLKQSMKIMGVICNLPIIVLIVCGEKFFACWQPTQDAKELQLLSLLTCAGLIVNGGINCIYNIFTVVNKLKYNSIVLLISSAISVVCTFILVKVTDLGVYAVAGVSTVIMVIKNIVFIIPYAAKCIGLKWYTFYPDVIRPIIFVIISSAINYFLIKPINGKGWINLIVCAVVTVVVALALGMFIILNRSDRKLLISKVLRRGKNENS